jgi:hypothetical protein
VPILKSKPQMPAPLQRPHVDPAPHLTSAGSCSYCGCKAITAANNMLVCPECFALLRHEDYSAELRRKQELINQKIKETRERNRQLDAERKDRIREERRQIQQMIKAEEKLKPPEQDKQHDDNGQ